MIQSYVVDGADGGFGIGIGGEQHPFCFGKNDLGLLQKIYAQHLGHALVGQKQSYRFALLFEFGQTGQRIPGRIGADDAVIVFEFIAQVAFERA